MESRFGGMEEMLRKLIEMQSKTPLTIPIANPHHDVTKIPLDESKEKEIGKEEFNEKSFFHHEPPPRALVRGGIGFPDGEIAGIEFCGGGGGVTDH
ncbi:hypothetical protein IEQ34_008736 [Dendrobium chrysotoxum]|uniref:Uncharacterized protein n=1 Tax=Dendrobium chrysotoxum TaxID=161865 RepID=A0AAV7GWP6_DENCH|nr:hypothetical protein IEQ34_008736 [Dendrobium chrysotoxum]